MTRPTQADRRARSRAALLEATARAISRSGYGQLRLDDVAAEAGYTRGALYHQFPDKEALVLATVDWVHETWDAEVGRTFDEELPPADALVALARRHAVYCRRDVAGVMAALRVEFGGREHPIGEAVRAIVLELVGRVERLIEAGRAQGAIPPGPPARTLAGATLTAIEGAVIALAGNERDDEEVAERVARGLIGVQASCPPRGFIRMNYDDRVLEPGPFIQTLSGRRVNPLDAAVEDIDPADIARALSNLCRFGGHSKAFYSVAQHSVIVCDLLEERGATPDELMAALLHDAAEAYLGDLPHPLKHRSELGAAFRVAEKRLEAVIAERFALPEASARIKPLDKALLATERRTFSEVTWHWPELDGAEELDMEIEPWDAARALEEFSARYERIAAQRSVD